MLGSLTETVQTLVDATQANAFILMSIVALLWGIFFLNILLQRRLLVLGLYPRKAFGLVGIAFAPLLHVNFNHLFFNTIPLVILSDFVLISGQSLFFNVTFYIMLLSGLLTWCFGRSAFHVGASSLITGYWGFLVMNIYQQGGIMAILLGLICIYYFAGIFLGIFPQQKGVSFEGHLFGLIAGIATSYGLFYLPMIF